MKVQTWVCIQLGTHEKEAHNFTCDLALLGVTLVLERVALVFIVYCSVSICPEIFLYLMLVKSLPFDDGCEAALGMFSSLLHILL